MGTQRCMVCGQKVTYRADSGFWHEDGTSGCVVDGIQPVDARPEPGQEVCDFCGAHDASWTLKAQEIGVSQMSYDTETLETQGTVTHAMSPDWAACTDCHRDLVKRKLERVARRCVRNLRQKRAGVQSTLEVRDGDHRHRAFGRDSPEDEEMFRLVMEMHEELLKTDHRWVRT